MRSTNTIFHATQVVFDESTFLHCPGSRASIPAIETGVLNIDEENIPSEAVESHQAPPAVEANPIWLHGGGYPYIPDNIVPGDQLPPGDPPVSPPSPSMSYMLSSRRGPPNQGSESKAPSQRSGSTHSRTSSRVSSSEKQAPPSASGGSSRYRTPPPRSPCANPDSSYGFFNPNPGPDRLYNGKEISYNPDGSPLNIRYNYMRHGRQYSWDWHNPTAPVNPNIPEGWRPWGCPDLDNSVFEEFL